MQSVLECTVIHDINKNLGNCKNYSLLLLHADSFVIQKIEKISNIKISLFLVQKDICYTCYAFAIVF